MDMNSITSNISTIAIHHSTVVLITSLFFVSFSLFICLPYCLEISPMALPSSYPNFIKKNAIGLLLFDIEYGRSYKQFLSRKSQWMRIKIILFTSHHCSIGIDSYTAWKWKSKSPAGNSTNCRIIALRHLFIYMLIITYQSTASLCDFVVGGSPHGGNFLFFSFAQEEQKQQN